MKARKKKKKHIKRYNMKPPKVQWGSKWITVSLKIPRELLAERLTESK